MYNVFNQSIRTGLEFKPRKTYDYNDHKEGLQRQLGEKEQKKAFHQQVNFLL